MCILHISMKTKALLMTIAMMSAALAGCTGSDGVAEIDDETLQQLFEDNIQDFMNNTTVTVNQEIHYHNNTTTMIDDGDYSNSVVNEYNNTTNVDGGEVINNYEQNDYSNTSYSIGSGGASFGEGVNGSLIGSNMLFVAHVNFSGVDLFPDYQAPGDPQDESFTYQYGYYDYLTNSYRNDTFTFSCSIFYVVGSANGSSNQVSFWENPDNYGYAWQQMYNSTVSDLLSEAGGTQYVRSLCEGNSPYPLATSNDAFAYEFFSIDIPMGYAIKYVQLNSHHTWEGYYGTLRYYSGNFYEDNAIGEFYTFSEGVNPRSSDHSENLYGGWENITISFDLKITSEGDHYGNGNYDYGMGQYSVWPSSEYSFTLYYQLIPVIPVV